MEVYNDLMINTVDTKALGLWFGYLEDSENMDISFNVMPYKIQEIIENKGSDIVYMHGDESIVDVSTLFTCEKIIEKRLLKHNIRFKICIEYGEIWGHMEYMP